MNRAATFATLLGIAALAGSCEPTLPWDGSLTVEATGAFEGSAPGRVTARSFPGQGGGIAIQGRGNRDGIASLTISGDFQGDLTTTPSFTHSSAGLFLLDGRSFNTNSFAAPGSVRFELREVKVIERRSSELRYEVHGTVTATLAQTPDGTVELSTTF